MNVVIFTRNLPADYLGGAEIHTLLLAQALATRGHTVTVVAGGAKDSRRRDRGVVIVRSRAFSYPYLFRTVLLPYWRDQFRKSVREVISSADIVHGFDLDSLLLLSGWKEIRSKLVATIQDYSIICPAGDLLTVNGELCRCHGLKSFKCHRQYDRASFYQLYCRIAYPFRFAVRSRLFLHLPHIIFISKFVSSQFGRVFGDELTAKTAVISNFIPDSWLREVSTPSKKLFDILYVGRVERYKGIDVLLTSLHIAAKKFPAPRVAIVGSGNVKFYRKKAAAFGLAEQVQFFGAVPYSRVRDYYLKSKIVVVPSVWSEPCGRTVIEGMGMGNVVVATNSGGTPELLEDRKTGFLIPPNDPVALERKLRYALNHYAKLYSMRRRAKAHVRNHYLSQQIVQQYESVYRQFRM